MPTTPPPGCVDAICLIVFMTAMLERFYMISYKLFSALVY